jgi:hypothetical protein
LCIVNLTGKGTRVRTVPMPAWPNAAGINTGRVFRPMAKGSRITGDVLLPQNIMEAVVVCGEKIGVPKLAHRGRAAIEQIQLSLGHASIVTTERYLGVRQDLHDFLGSPWPSPPYWGWRLRIIRRYVNQCAVTVSTARDGSMSFCAWF